MDVLVVLVVMLAFAAIAVVRLRRKKAPVELEPDLLEGQEAGPDYDLRWGEAQELVEMSGFQGNQYRTWTEVQTRDFVEVQARPTEGQAPRALRINTLPEPQRTLARALDANDVLITDDRVRISWRDGMGDLHQQRARALMLFTVMRHPGPELLSKFKDIAARVHRTHVLEYALAHLHTLPGIEVLARSVSISDSAELRVTAAIVLDNAEVALDPALQDQVSPELSLRTVAAFMATRPDDTDALLSKLLARTALPEDERRRVLARVRTLPPARMVAVLVDVVGSPQAADALELLCEVAPERALPHLHRLVKEAQPPLVRLAAARLLHRFEPAAAEAVLVELAQGDAEAAVEAVTELGRLGSEHAVAPLRALARLGTLDEIGEAATASLAEVRGRLASRPAGALALSDVGDGGLSLAHERAGASKQREDA